MNAYDGDDGPSLRMPTRGHRRRLPRPRRLRLRLRLLLLLRRLLRSAAAASSSASASSSSPSSSSSSSSAASSAAASSSSAAAASAAAPSSAPPSPAGHGEYLGQHRRGQLSRSATPAAFNAGTACGSLDAANDLCRNGDSVVVRGGTYSQGGDTNTITGTNGRTDYCNFTARRRDGRPGGCNGSNPANQGASMCLDIMGNAGWIRLDGGSNNGFTTPAFPGHGIDLGVTTWYGHFDTERGCTHVTFRPFMWAPSTFICPSTEVSYSELGPALDNNSKFFGDANPVLIQGNRIHDYYRSNVDQHGVPLLRRNPESDHAREHRRALRHHRDPARSTRPSPTTPSRSTSFCGCERRRIPVRRPAWSTDNVFCGGRLDDGDYVDCHGQHLPLGGTTPCSAIAVSNNIGSAWDRSLHSSVPGAGRRTERNRTTVRPARLPSTRETPEHRGIRHRG